MFRACAVCTRLYLRKHYLNIHISFLGYVPQIKALVGLIRSLVVWGAGRSTVGFRLNVERSVREISPTIEMLIGSVGIHVVTDAWKLFIALQLDSWSPINGVSRQHSWHAWNHDLYSVVYEYNTGYPWSPMVHACSGGILSSLCLMDVDSVDVVFFCGR